MNLGSKVENSEKEEKKKKGLLDVMFPSKSHLFSASKKSFYLKILYVLKKLLSLSAAALYYVYHHKFDLLISWSGLGSFFVSSSTTVNTDKILYTKWGNLSLIKALW